MRLPPRRSTNRKERCLDSRSTGAVTTLGRASLKERLQAGTTVICDRYAYSGVAFSAAKPGLDLEWCKECDQGLPAPDMVIFLDVPIEKAAEVRARGRGALGLSGLTVHERSRRMARAGGR
jgi:thymidylate kinase